jgi:hypothetical protein
MKRICNILNLPVCTFAVLITSIVALQTCHGRIGWTLEECEQKYGASIPTDNPITFDFNGAGCYRITAVFRNGRVAWMSYNHKDTNVPYSSFSQSEIADLLSQNINGYRWTKTGQDDYEVDYIAHLDGRIAMQAWYAKGTAYASKPTLMIASAEWTSIHGWRTLYTDN